MRIAFQRLLHLQRKPAHAPSHVGPAQRDPDPDVARNGDHRRNARRTVVTNELDAPAMTRTVAPSNLDNDRRGVRRRNRSVTSAGFAMVHR